MIIWAFAAVTRTEAIAMTVRVDMVMFGEDMLSVNDLFVIVNVLERECSLAQLAKRIQMQLRSVLKLRECVVWQKKGCDAGCILYCYAPYTVSGASTTSTETLR